MCGSRVSDGAPLCRNERAGPLPQENNPCKAPYCPGRALPSLYIFSFDQKEEILPPPSMYLLFALVSKERNYIDLDMI